MLTGFVHEKEVQLTHCCPGKEYRNITKKDETK